MNKIKANINDVVQIVSGNWLGALVHVTETKSWGIQGFVYIPEQGQAFIRIKHENYEIIGKAALAINR